MADIYNLLATWNNGATTFDGIAIDITDTASASASKLLNLAVGGTSKFGVRKDGLVNLASGTTLAGNGDGGAIFADAAGTTKAAITSGGSIVLAGSVQPTSGSAAAPSLRFSSEATGFYLASGGATAYVSGGNEGLRFDNALGLGLKSSALLWFTSGSTGAYSTRDVVLARDAAGILADRNGTNAQAFRVYNTYTGSADEWFAIDWKTTANTCLLKTAANGGSSRSIKIESAGQIIDFGNSTGQTVRMYTPTSGYLVLGSGMSFGFRSSTDVASGGMDVHVSRGGSGSLKVGTTNGATDGSISLATITASGNVNFTGLPTADPHVVGQLWNNSGVLTVSAG